MGGATQAVGVFDLKADRSKYDKSIARANQNHKKGSALLSLLWYFVILQSAQHRIKSNIPSDVESVGGAKQAGSDVELVGGAKQAGSDVEPVGGAKQAGSDVELVGGAKQAGSDVELVGGAKQAGSDVEPVGGAKKAVM